MVTPNEHAGAWVWRDASSENLLAPNIWIGTTTTSGGAWSVTFTGQGFASPPVVMATAQLEDTDVFNRAAASLSSAPTVSGASGYAVRWANLALLGSAARTVPDGTVVHVVAIGESYAEE